jgi:hypothetical protein
VLSTWHPVLSTRITNTQLLHWGSIPRTHGLWVLLYAKNSKAGPKKFAPIRCKMTTTQIGSGKFINHQTSQNVELLCQTTHLHTICTQWPIVKVYDKRLSFLKSMSHGKTAFTWWKPLLDICKSSKSVFASPKLCCCLHILTSTSVF